MSTVCCVHEVEIVADFIDRGDTMTDERYFCVHLKTLRHVICRKTPRLLLQGVTSSYYNTSPHTANQIVTGYGVTAGRL
jgi:hypothetical protein